MRRLLGTTPSALPTQRLEPRQLLDPGTARQGPVRRIPIDHRAW